MAIIQALLAAATRSAGKLLNTVFAWATVLLFGRVSEDRQIYISALAFGSVIWLVVLIGVAFPSVGTFLLSFVPLPEWVDKKWMRLAMLAAVIIIPAVVGVISVLMLEKPERPRGAAAIAKTVLRGYPYTVGLVVTLAMMTAFAPILKVRTLAKRWTSEHVPVIIEPEDYTEVVGSTQQALDAGGFATVRRRPSWLLRAPTQVLTLFARSAVANLLVDQMTLLASPELEVLLHPSDLIISARKGTAARVRAVLAERLVFTPAHLTWDKEANEIEDRLVAIWKARESQPPAMSRQALVDVHRDLQRLESPYEEWEVLFREALMIERTLRPQPTRETSRRSVRDGLASIADLADAVEAIAREWRRSNDKPSNGGTAVASAAGAALRSIFGPGLSQRLPRTNRQT